MRERERGREREREREREKDGGRETEMHSAAKSQPLGWIANPSARFSQSLASQPGEDTAMFSPVGLEG